MRRKGFRGQPGQWAVFSFLMIIALGTLLFPASAWAGEEETAASPGSVDEMVRRQVEGLDLKAMEDVIQQVDQEVREYLELPDSGEALLRPTEIAKNLDPRQIFSTLVRYLFKEVLANIRLLGQLVILAVILALLQSMQGAFGDRSFGDLTFSVAFLSLILIGLRSFTIALGYGRQAIDGMASAMQAVMPVLGSMLAAAGGVVTAALLNPVVYAVITLVGVLVKDVVLPLLFLGAVFGLVANLSNRFPMSRLAGMARQLSVGALGLLFAIFLGTMVVRGVTGPVADGISVRTGKFLVSNFIPVVGKMFSDAVEIVIGSSLLVKNAAGAVGILLIIAFCAFPILKITAIYFIYRLAGVLVQPISDPRLIEAMGQLESTLLFLAVVVATVGLMYFMALSVMISLGGLTFLGR